MKLSYNWLKELTKTKLSPEKVAELLNLQVAGVEGVDHLAKCLENVVVAEILEITKHPQADKLQLVKVALDSKKQKILEIVCGAFNIKVGDKVPLALPGAKLSKGIEIKESVIRGVKSLGMLCAEDELGIGDDHQGILILDKSFKTGEILSRAIGMDDSVIDIETVAITHRPDLFGHLGFARELSALTNSKLVTKTKNSKLVTKNLFNLNIKVEDFKDCPRYLALIFDGVKVKSSPVWLQNRLRSLGVRPINNIVDITNYVMLEIGQPLHAFDYDKLEECSSKSKNIFIRRAKNGEKILSLDGVERKLDNEVLVIADSKYPIALAGIMGGEYSGITEKTKTVVIESANFNPVIIRRAAKKLGIRTEANTRFEKNLPIVFTEEAMARVAELIKEFAQGKAASKIYDLKSPTTEKFIKTKKLFNLETQKINDLIGENIPEKQIIKYLVALGFEVKKTGKLLRIVVPAHRNDIEYAEDIIEEIARIYGYQKIKPQPIETSLEVVAIDPLLKLEKNLKNILVGLGFDELYNYSFYGEKTINHLKLNKEQHLEIANPLNPDQQYLRLSLLPKLLEKAGENNPLFENFRIFEIGKIYKQNNEKVDQEKYLGGLILEKNKNMFFMIKGAIETILSNVGISQDQISYQLNHSQNYQYLDNFTGIMVKGEAIGLFGLVKKQLRDSLKISADLGVFEINLEKLLKFRKDEKKFQKISSYPPVIRDLALIISKRIAFSQIYQEIKKYHQLINFVEPFDVFESEKIGKDMRSIAFHLTFQSFDRTLVSEEIDKIINALVKNLELKFQVKLRNF